MSANIRPRLLYFNGPWHYISDRLRASYIEPFRRLLEQDFEVISVEGDCDFRREVERHRPDAALFHTGIECENEPEVSITNTDAFPELPRMGYVARDPFSPSRLSAMNRLRAWRVDQSFYWARASDSPNSVLADAIYVPWWIDDTIFRDYSEPKTLPITFTGSGWLRKQFYTWRNPVFVQLVLKLPIYHVPAFGSHQKQEVYVGESYARLLNRSMISAGCGSVCRYVTLKLFEIPAARCCLITEETELLKALGFVDGVNCVFVTEQNVVAKVQALLDDPAQLQAITDAGFKLVHERHTARNRRMFAEWLQLWRQRRPGQRVVQSGAFAPLRLVNSDTALPPAFPTENPLNDQLRGGYAHLEAGRWHEAIEQFKQVLEMVPYVAEAQLGGVIALLNLGLVANAVRLLESIQTNQHKLFAGTTPDPLVLAFTVITLARNNQSSRAIDLLAEHAHLKHPALNALRWVSAARWPALQRKHPAWAADENCETQTVETLHVLPARSFSAWVDYWHGWLNPQSTLAASA